MEEKDAGNEIALTRRKPNRYHFTYYRYTSGQGTPLRATVESGFRIARYIMQIVRLAPVEYLTYEIRRASDLMRRRGGRPCPPDCIAEYFDYLAG